jgi:hypothetical protein
MMRAAALLLVATVASADPPKPPLVFAPLAWDATVDAASKALDKAKMSPRAGERHGYFSGQTSHTIEPELFFVPRKDWTGEARWQTPSGPLVEITITATKLTDATLRDEFAALHARYGAPDRITDVSGHQELWVRGGIWLAAFTGVDGGTRTLTLGFRKDDRPLP